MKGIWSKSRNALCNLWVLFGKIIIWKIQISILEAAVLLLSLGYCYLLHCLEYLLLVCMQMIWMAIWINLAYSLKIKISHFLKLRNQMTLQLFLHFALQLPTKLSHYNITLFALNISNISKSIGSILVL